MYSHGICSIHAIRLKTLKPSAKPHLVIFFDGEDLGHTPDSSERVPTAMTRRFDEVDAVLLVATASEES